MTFVSVRGKALGYDRNNLFLNGRIIGGSTPTAVGRGKTFYVDSAVDASSGTSPSNAVGTLDEAFALCTASQGDTIIVMPNHSETITGAGGITHDVAGVSVIGLGHYNQRPRFLMDAGTSVTYLISAADAYVSGLEFASGHSNVATCFNVTAVGAWINDCKFGNNTTNEDFLLCVSASGAANTADGLTVSNCRWYTIDTDDSAMISFTDNAKDFRCLDNFMVTASATAAQMVTCAAGKLLLNAEIGRCRLKNAMTSGELFFSNDGSTNTGIAYDIMVQHLDTTTTHDVGLESSGLALFNIWSTSTIALQGGVIPAADVNL